jgi:hypothetical protein
LFSSDTPPQAERDASVQLFSAPGAGKFEEKDLSAFFNGGMFGNGVFALFAHDIFVSGAATYRFFGEEPIEGRKLLRYDYDISFLNSGYLIKTQHGQARVAYHGSLWADPRTLQALRVDVKAEFYIRQVANALSPSAGWW